MAVLGGIMNEPKEHGIAAAYYIHGPVGLEPTLECLCGLQFSEMTWAEVGVEFDGHLKVHEDERKDV